MAIQEELRAEPIPDELDEPYEEEPRRRSWSAIASVVLALAVIFVGYQWNQAVGREQVLRSEMHALLADAETLRLRAEEAERQAALLERQVAALTAGKEALAQRVAAVEQSSRQRVSAVRPTPRERASSTGPSRTRQRAAAVPHKKRR